MTPTIEAGPLRRSRRRTEKQAAGAEPGRATVAGKFFRVGGQKLYIRGVTYGPFGSAEEGEYGRPERVALDFARIRAMGANLVRLYTVPPSWLLDLARDHGLHVMVGLPWEQHVAFLDDPADAARIEASMRAAVASCAGHPAVLCYCVGNEIPSSIVRWYGAARVEAFLRRLYDAVKTEDPGALVTYVNYPTTEYLQLDFLDFVAFNVYLESREALEAYLGRLQNLAGDRPLLMAEVGLDSRQHGERAQAVALDWQVRTAFAAGCAGVTVFSWTDEWSRGGENVTGWDFGLTTREGRPKAELHAVREAFSEVPFAGGVSWPKVSVVVCTRNGARTLDECLAHVRALDYPEYELLVVDDGSTDATATIAEAHGARLIRRSHGGLSAARNAGIEASTGEIVAFLDDDAYPDPHWLRYLAHVFIRTDAAGVGGPNIPPPEDGFLAGCIARSPGGPIHVLLSDRQAEHLPGCNMAFRKVCLDAIGGFDPQFWVAGDDVDLCWRIQEKGWTLGFHAGAMVWHHRRPCVRGYLRQQRGYGKAEAMLERKWPEKYNAAGHIAWGGRVYSPNPLTLLRRGRIYQGTWGSALFQSVYQPAPSTAASLVAMPEWYLVIAGLGGLAALGAQWEPLRLAVWLLIAASAASLGQAAAAAASAARAGVPRGERTRFLCAVWALHLLQPGARLAGRLRHGLTPLRRRTVTDVSSRATRETAIWSEIWFPADRWLSELEGGLRTRRQIVLRGGDFDDWDLEVRNGTLGAVRIRMAVEEHGQGRQLVRFRCLPRHSRARLALIAVFALLAAGATRDGALTAGLALGAAAALLLLRKWHERSRALLAAGAAIRDLAHRFGALTIPSAGKQGEQRPKRAPGQPSPGPTISAVSQEPSGGGGAPRKLRLPQLELQPLHLARARGAGSPPRLDGTTGILGAHPALAERSVE